MYVLSARFRPSRAAGGEGAVVYTVREGAVHRELTSAIRGAGPEVLVDRRARIGFELKTICCVIEALDGSGSEFNIGDVVDGSVRALGGDNPFAEMISSSGDGFRANPDVVRISRRFVRPSVRPVTCGHDMLLVDYLDVLSDRYMEGSKRMARSFVSLGRSISEYTEGEDVRMADLDGEFFAGYRDFLNGRVSDSTCQYYLRTLRAALNNARRDNVADIRISLHDVCADGSGGRAGGRDAKVLEREVLRDIGNLNLAHEPFLELVRDMFMFSFYGHGIELSDLANLRKENLSGNRLHYRRRQAGRSVEVTLGCMSERIVRKYADAESPYLLPILWRGGRSYSYETVKSTFYKSLRAIGEMLTPGVKLSFSMARPSWEHMIQRLSVAEALV